jgi:hypothetical protein
MNQNVRTTDGPTFAGATLTSPLLMGSTVAAAANTQPTALSYGLLQGFGNFTLAADTDGSQSEFAIITAGYAVASATAANGLAIGYNTLTWKNNVVLHAGNFNSYAVSGAGFSTNQNLRTTDSPTFAGLNLGSGDLNTVGNIYLNDVIYHSGDTNTYIQFHAADQWRVVTGGSERLEVNNSAVSINSGIPLVMQGRIEPDTPADYDQTAITSLTNAPIYYPEVNVGTTDTFLPAFHMRSLYSSGYRTHMNVGLYKRASAWGDNDTGFYVALGGNDSYPTKHWKLTYGTDIYNSDGYVSTPGSFRAPIFYDSDNTAYYGDFASTSIFNKLQLFSGTASGATGYSTNSLLQIESSGNQYIEFRTSAGSSGIMQGLLFTDNGRNAFIGFKEFTGAAGATYGESVHFSISDFSASDPGSGFWWGTSSDNANGVTSPLLFLRSNGNFNLGYGADQGFRMAVNGTAFATSDFRAPQFIDSNNTAFYIDPNGYSNVSQLNAAEFFIDGLKVLNSVGSNTATGTINAIWGMLKPTGYKL